MMSMSIYKTTVLCTRKPMRAHLFAFLESLCVSVCEVATHVLCVVGRSLSAAGEPRDTVVVVAVNAVIINSK
jgi:hypothetical protein